MRRIFSPIGVGLLLFVAAACTGQRSTPATPSDHERQVTAAPNVVATFAPEYELTAVPSPTAVATVEPELPRTVSFDAPELQGVRELSWRVALAVDGAEYRVGVVVLDLDRNVAYAGGADEAFVLASVSKLAIALGLLRRAELDARELSWGERDQLGLMLSESKNGPAVELWASLGADAVSEALSWYGVSGFQMPPDEQWGDMAASATDVATLLRLFVADGSPLRAEDRELVLSLLQSVVAGQRWGVSAGVDISDEVGTVLAIKNGWYPDGESWLVNSAGAVAVAGETNYVVVALSEGAPGFPEGVRGIEEIATTVNSALYGAELLVARTEFMPGLEVEALEIPGTEATDDEQAPDVPALDDVAAVEFVALETTEDVLVPRGQLLTSTTLEDSIAIWFEIPESDVEVMLGAYLGLMRGLGWTAISGPPELVLSKHAEGRFVVVTPLVSAPGGTQVIEFRISPVPAPMIGAAAVE